MGGLFSFKTPVLQEWVVLFTYTPVLQECMFLSAHTHVLLGWVVVLTYTPVLQEWMFPLHPNSCFPEKGGPLHLYTCSPEMGGPLSYKLLFSRNRSSPSPKRPLKCVFFRLSSNLLFSWNGWSRFTQTPVLN